MSSWLVSLGWLGRSVAWLRRSLDIGGLCAACIRDGLFDAAPCRLMAKARSQILQQRRNLLIIHAGGKPRHDRTALALDRANPRKHSVGGIARIRAADGGGERQIDPAIGQR